MVTTMHEFQKTPGLDWKKDERHDKNVATLVNNIAEMLKASYPDRHTNVDVNVESAGYGDMYIMIRSSGIRSPYHRYGRSSRVSKRKKVADRFRYTISSKTLEKWFHETLNEITEIVERWRVQTAEKDEADRKRAHSLQANTDIFSEHFPDKVDASAGFQKAGISASPAGFVVEAPWDIKRTTFSDIDTAKRFRQKLTDLMQEMKNAGGTA